MKSDRYWLNNNDLFEFLADNQFVWGSERDGFEHLYVYGLDGKQRRRLTEGNWEVTEIAGIDEAHGKLYFVSSEASPLERQLYSIRLNGKDRTRISQGAGTHSISMSPTMQYYLDSFSSVTDPPRRTLRTADGGEWAVYRSPDHRWTDEYQVQTPELVNFKGSDGTLFYGSVIKPASFQAGQKYPPVVLVYGGPGAQSVRNAWSASLGAGAG